MLLPSVQRGWVFVLLSASTLKYTNVMRFHYQWYACREDFLSPSNQVQQYCTEEQQLKHWCDRARKTKKKTFLDHDDDDCQQKKAVTYGVSERSSSTKHRVLCQHQQQRDDGRTCTTATVVVFTVIADWVFAQHLLPSCFI